MRPTSRFRVTALIVLSVASLANAAPYLLTRDAHQRDGQQVAGLPFPFHRIGGDCWPAACRTFDFHAGYFAADVLLALLLAVASGLVAATMQRGAGSPT